MTFAKISYQLSLLQCDAAEPDAEIHDNQVIIFHILHLESPCKLVAPYVTKFGLYHGFKHHVFKDVSGSCIMDIYICHAYTHVSGSWICWHQRASRWSEDTCIIFIQAVENQDVHHSDCRQSDCSKKIKNKSPHKILVRYPLLSESDQLSLRTISSSNNKWKCFLTRL